MPLLTEGATDKVLQFMMPGESFTLKNFDSMNKNVFLNTAERLKPKTIFKMALFLFKLFCLTFWSCVL
jgi:hypothetical protein